ncbi:uncharacterized protein LOC126576629 [Anopheles aquasalis]|uniref:uncharacterized protein LOC126576629 n=1 Tax=Anopheles aquasalis TaxID=42839 RepID=UPI00215ACB5D|nr:uncharacterized protein LOC126576629 [Anopheles aquasalis]
MTTNTSTKLKSFHVYDGEYLLLYERISEKIRNDTSDIYLDIKLLARLKFNRMMRLMIACTHGMDVLVYFAISKGHVVDVGFFRPNQRTRYYVQILVSNKLIPRSKLVFLAYTNGVFRSNFLDVSVRELGNPIEIKIEENIGEDGVDPGDEFELSIRGRPGAFVALASYDQRLMQYRTRGLKQKYHDIFLDDIWELQ